MIVKGTTKGELITKVASLIERGAVKASPPEQVDGYWVQEVFLPNERVQLNFNVATQKLEITSKVSNLNDLKAIMVALPQSSADLIAEIGAKLSEETGKDYLGEMDIYGNRFSYRVRRSYLNERLKGRK